MTRHTIAFVDPVRIVERSEDDDAFVFRKDRPHHWLQRACIGILRRLKCFSFVENVRIERHELDGKTFVDRLFKQRNSLFSQYHEPKTLLIGAEDYAELMREVCATQPFKFVAPVRWGRMKVLGLEVRVIPWMSGMVVMPEKWGD